MRLGRLIEVVFQPAAFTQCWVAATPYPQIFKLPPEKAEAFSTTLMWLFSQRVNKGLSLGFRLGSLSQKSLNKSPEGVRGGRQLFSVAVVFFLKTRLKGKLHDAFPVRVC